VPQCGNPVSCARADPLSTAIKVGIIEDGRVTRSQCGAPQGAVISPTLANAYLHYTYDLWVHRWRQTKATGDMIAVRFADDTIVGFEHEQEAKAFLQDLHERLRSFELAFRHAAWWSHLGHDEGPLAQMMDELHGSYAEAISRLPANESDQDVRELLQNRLAQYIVLLHLWDALPDDLLNDFCRAAPDAVRRHAMWYVGDLVSGPATEARAKMTARGLKYWERRLAAAIQSGRPDDYRGEIGTISHWCFHGTVDETWLGEQLVKMLTAGFVPNDAYDVIEWLQAISPNHIDRAVEVMQLLLRNPRIDR
jgi:hypothetical protein